MFGKYCHCKWLPVSLVEFRIAEENAIFLLIHGGLLQSISASTGKDFS